MIYFFKNTVGKTTIYNFLKTILSENIITSLRKNLGTLSINNCTKRTNETIDLGETLEINYLEDEEFLPNYPANDINFDIIYEDEYYLIMDKPSNICTIPTINHFTDNLASAVLFYQKKRNQTYKFRALNRLDLGTSGIVVIAKDPICYNLLQKFGKVEKEYVALVEGKIEKDIVISGNILDDNKLKKHYIDCSNNSIKTFVVPLKYYKKENITLIKTKLVGGRTNQIRVHLSSIGNSLAGDIKYGGKTNIFDTFFLRCFSIKFFHSILNKNIELTLDYMLPQGLRD